MSANCSHYEDIRARYVGLNLIYPWKISKEDQALIAKYAEESNENFGGFLLN
jgi:hypothetical protein